MWAMNVERNLHPPVPSSEIGDRRSYVPGASAGQSAAILSDRMLSG